MDTTSFGYRVRRHLGLRLTVPLLGVCARRVWVRLTAWLLRSQIIRLTRASRGPAALNIVILPKPGFTEDIAASLGDDPRFRIYAFDRLLLKTVFRAFLPPVIDDKNYVSAGVELDAPKAALRDFWNEVWPLVDPDRRYAAVLTGNFSYHAEQEFTAALNDLGTAVIAVHKENLKTPGLAKFFEKLYRERKSPFLGRSICTYNSIEKNLEVAAGMAPAETITVTGMPRLDRIHRWRLAQECVRKTGARPMVLFFSFGSKTGAPLIQRKWPKQMPPARETLSPELESVGWSDLARACHEAMVRLAIDHSDLDVVIKSKGDLRARGVLADIFGDNYIFPDNLLLVSEGDPFDLIIRADVICGFNTTALLETMAAGVPLIIPTFAEAACAANRPYVLDLGESAEISDTVEDLITRLAARARATHDIGHRKTLGAAQRATLDHWLGNGDGEAGGRVADVVFTAVGGATS